MTAVLIDIRNPLVLLSFDKNIIVLAHFALSQDTLK